MPRLGGGELSHDDLIGKPTLLVFLDPDCRPCDQVAPELEQIHRTSKAFRVVGISRGSPDANRLKAAALGLTFPIALQRHWEVSRSFAMVAAPVAYLLDEHRVVRSDVAVGHEAIVNMAAGELSARGRGAATLTAPSRVPPEAE